MAEIVGDRMIKDHEEESSEEDLRRRLDMEVSQSVYGQYSLENRLIDALKESGPMNWTKWALLFEYLAGKNSPAVKACAFNIWKDLE